VSFEGDGTRTRLVMHELYRSKEHLDAAMQSGEKCGLDETFAQLDALLVSQRP
jgi:quinol monooxygenase YgiN